MRDPKRLLALGRGHILFMRHLTVADHRDHARRHMEPAIRDYFDNGADDEITLKLN